MGTKEKNCKEKKSACHGSVSFIQSALPLILISNRPLDSRQTNGLITDRDKKRKNGRRGSVCARIHSRPIEARFFFVLFRSIPFFEITSNTAKGEIKNINTRYLRENRNEVDLKNLC